MSVTTINKKQYWCKKINKERRWKSQIFKAQIKVIFKDKICKN